MDVVRNSRTARQEATPSALTPKSGGHKIVTADGISFRRLADFFLEVGTGPNLAGSVSRYSNQALEHLTEALARFASPRHPEKTLEELQQLLRSIDLSKPPALPRRAIRTRKVEQRLGPEQLDALVASYQSGLSANAIGKRFGISAASVMRIVRRNGLDVHVRGRPADVSREAGRLYKAGSSRQRLSEQFGYSTRAIRHALVEAGAQIRPPKHD